MKSGHQSIKLPKCHVKPSGISIALHNPAWNPGGDVKGANCLAKQRRIVPPTPPKNEEEEIGEDRLTFAIDGDNGEWRKDENTIQELHDL